MQLLTRKKQFCSVRTASLSRRTVGDAEGLTAAGSKRHDNEAGCERNANAAPRRAASRERAQTGRRGRDVTENAPSHGLRHREAIVILQVEGRIPGERTENGEGVHSSSA